MALVESFSPRIRLHLSRRERWVSDAAPGQLHLIALRNTVRSDRTGSRSFCLLEHDFPDEHDFPETPVLASRERGLSEFDHVPGQASCLRRGVRKTVSLELVA